MKNEVRVSYNKFSQENVQLSSRFLSIEDEIVWAISHFDMTEYIYKQFDIQFKFMLQKKRKKKKRTQAFLTWKFLWETEKGSFQYPSVEEKKLRRISHFQYN